MGVHSLWKYLDHHDVVNVLNDVGEVQHLFFDMNSLLHTSYNRARPTVSATLSAVSTLIETILIKYKPSLTLSFVFDGPGPIAKLRTQRERRKSMLASDHSLELSPAVIAAGSPFVLSCESMVEDVLLPKLVTGTKSLKLPKGLRINMSKTSEAGEGELKIVRKLQEIYSEQLADGSYCGKDRIFIFGNDSDLVLCCIATTMFHNYYVVNPFSLLTVDVGELMTHWLKNNANQLLPLNVVATFRLDFVFIMLLAGGDYYRGIEGTAVDVWRKYRDARLEGGFYRTSLVIFPECNLNRDFLLAILAPDTRTFMRHYTGSKNKMKQVKEQHSNSKASPEKGVHLLHGALWVLAGIVNGGCVHYGYCPPAASDTMSTTTSHVRAALKLKASFKPPVATMETGEDGKPLTPHQAFVAVVGHRGYLESFFRAKCGTEDVLEDALKRLTAIAKTNNPQTIRELVRTLFQVSVQEDDSAARFSFAIGFSPIVVQYPPGFEVMISRSLFKSKTQTTHVDVSSNVVVSAQKDAPP